MAPGAHLPESDERDPRPLCEPCLALGTRRVVTWLGACREHVTRDMQRKAAVELRAKGHTTAEIARSIYCGPFKVSVLLYEAGRWDLLHKDMRPVRGTMPDHLLPPKAPMRTPANQEKTHCPKGHPYDEENTYLHPRGYRACRACQREHKRAYERTGRKRSDRCPMCAGQKSRNAVRCRRCSDALRRLPTAPSKC